MLLCFSAPAVLLFTYSTAGESRSNGSPLFYIFLQAGNRGAARREAGAATAAAGAAAGAPGFVWGSASAVISRVFTSRVSAPGFTRGSTFAAKARPLNRRRPRFLSPPLPATQASERQSLAGPSPSISSSLHADEFVVNPSLRRPLARSLGRGQQVLDHPHFLMRFLAAVKGDAAAIRVH